MSDFIWHGNPLTSEGTWCEAGGLRAELMRVDPMALIGSIFMPKQRVPLVIQRTWVLTISDPLCMPPLDALACVMLSNLMPEAAKREAETIFGWAVAARCESEAGRE